MGGPRDYHTQLSVSEWERQIYAITYMLNLKHETYEQTYEKERLTDTEKWMPFLLFTSHLWMPSVKGWGRQGLKFGVSRRKL